MGEMEKKENRMDGDEYFELEQLDQNLIELITEIRNDLKKYQSVYPEITEILLKINSSNEIIHEETSGVMESFIDQMNNFQLRAPESAENDQEVRFELLTEMINQIRQKIEEEPIKNDLSKISEEISQKILEGLERKHELQNTFNTKIQELLADGIEKQNTEFRTLEKDYEQIFAEIKEKLFNETQKTTSIIEEFLIDQQKTFTSIVEKMQEHILGSLQNIDSQFSTMENQLSLSETKASSVYTAMVSVLSAARTEEMANRKQTDHSISSVEETLSGIMQRIEVLYSNSLSALKEELSKSINELLEKKVKNAEDSFLSIKANESALLYSISNRISEIENVIQDNKTEIEEKNFEMENKILNEFHVNTNILETNLTNMNHIISAQFRNLTEENKRIAEELDKNRVFLESHLKINGEQLSFSQAAFREMALKANDYITIDQYEVLLQKINSLTSTFERNAEKQEVLAQIPAFIKSKIDPTFYFQLMIFASQWIILIVIIVLFFLKN